MVACPARAELHRYLIQDDSLSPEQVERIVDARRRRARRARRSWTA